MAAIVPRTLKRVRRRGYQVFAFGLVAALTYVIIYVPPLSSKLPILPDKDASASPLINSQSSSLTYKGIAYASWTKGQYPFTSSWEKQTFVNAQAITGVAVTGSTPYEGAGSLELDVNLVGGDPNKGAGETFVNMLLHPPAESPPNCPNGPINLAGIKVSVQVYAPSGSRGNSGLNTVQLYVRDDQMRSFFGTPQTFSENQWNEVSTTPSISAPPSGSVDVGFDPTRIAIVGFRVNAGAGSSYAGKIWLDAFDWNSGSAHPKYGFNNVENSLDRIKKMGANYVSLTVTWYQNTINSIAIYADPTKTHSDQEIVNTINEIHSRGMGVLLAPHVDVQSGEWRGLIDPSDKTAWFASYSSFITHYAQIAQANGVELFLAGSELSKLEGSAYRANWSSVISQIRSGYSGKLTYASNWDNYQNLAFWDLLDIAGIDGYFPLSDQQDPSLSDLMVGWSSYIMPGSSVHNWISEIEAWQAAKGKPVIFPEIGYHSRDYAAQQPWSTAAGGVYNSGLQARCYQAAMSAFKSKSWFQGMFVWDVLPYSDAGGQCDTDFTPQNKPAEGMIATLFGNKIFLPAVFNNATGNW